MHAEKGLSRLAVHAEEANASLQEYVVVTVDASACCRRTATLHQGARLGVTVESSSTVAGARRTSPGAPAGAAGLGTHKGLDVAWSSGKGRPPNPSNGPMCTVRDQVGADDAAVRRYS